ncbi:1,5-anhydro-D-fructose reductase [Symmachiella dynata]|uniref:1,5-anhydro-D-fructose reductase n=1 Tax=Symmachiella dynata TaxID=2527995 RepID=A0A517ZTL0_9PLAN|nr:Gfo/Idh/MocA family oxidoreductase [Symmachiella dynata]QDU45783.1 1,5-anhydro-D-fructose reductase [Symmachiella dynata]
MELQPELEYEIPLDDGLDQWGIGVVGSGFIISDCHLPAYRDAGFRVLGISSRREARAREVAEQRMIPRVFVNVRDMLADSEIRVIDIGVPPQHQPDIIREIVEHGRHVRGILAQKPLAMSYAEAHELVQLCTAAGITLAVNQNMRHDQSVRACQDLLDRKLLGDPVLGTINMRAIPHWMPWSEQLDSLSTYVMSIHHLDTFRYWFGDPTRVMASTRTDPRTKFSHTDGINLYILEFPTGCRASSWDDVWTGPAREGSAADIGITWRVEGTEGLARGTIGWPSYPDRTPSTLDYTTTAAEEWICPRWDKVWFPDAFRGTMGELLMALTHDIEPSISGKDNLKTMALVEATFAAARDHRVVELAEILET